MSKAQSMDFSVDKENRSIKIKREFAAELPLVWKAFTQKEILDQWWAPKPWKAKTKSMDFREGGTWLYAMVGPKGEEHFALVNYKTINDQRSFSGIDSFADSNGKINTEMPQSKWKVSFSKQDVSTLVEIDITFDDISQMDKYIEMGFKEGLSTAMEGLDEFIASKKIS